MAHDEELKGKNVKTRTQEKGFTRDYRKDFSRINQRKSDLS